MKYTSTQLQLFTAVKTLSKIATKNTSLPILKTVKMSISGNNLTLSATNLDIGAVISLPVKDSEDGECAVDVSVLLSYLSLIPGKTKVEVGLEDNHLIIRSEKGVARITLLDVGDFPEIPETNEGEAYMINFKSQDFVDGIRSVVFSCSNSTIRPELASVYIYQDGGDLVFVATDTFRLSEKRVKGKSSSEIGPILIPAKVANEVIKIVSGEESDIDVWVEDGQITIKTEDIRIVARTISGNFPEYKQIIPTSKDTEVVLLKDDVAAALKASTIFSDKFNQINISVNPNDKKVVFEAKNTTAGENSFDMSGSVVGDPISLNFNYGYFNDVMPVLKSDSIEFSFSGPGKPVVVRDRGGKDYLYLVMSMSKNS